MLVETILNDVCLDSRVKDGCFKIENSEHMDALREYLVNKGMEAEMAKEYCNKVVEGKYPERQAYNKNGILVTFPTPEYKHRAIKKGTHFDQDPTAGQKAHNLFTQDTPQQTPPQEVPDKGETGAGGQEGDPSQLPVTGQGGEQDTTQQSPNSVVQ